MLAEGGVTVALALALSYLKIPIAALGGSIDRIVVSRFSVTPSNDTVRFPIFVNSLVSGSRSITVIGAEPESVRAQVFVSCLLPAVVSNEN